MKVNSEVWGMGRLAIELFRKELRRSRPLPCPALAQIDVEIAKLEDFRNRRKHRKRKRQILRALLYGG